MRCFHLLGGAQLQTSDFAEVPVNPTAVNRHCRCSKPWRVKLPTYISRLLKSVSVFAMFGLAAFWGKGVDRAFWEADTRFSAKTDFCRDFLLCCLKGLRATGWVKYPFLFISLPKSDGLELQPFYLKGFNSWQPQVKILGVSTLQQPLTDKLRSMNFTLSVFQMGP